MKKIQIKLSTIEDVRNFVNTLAQYSADFDLISGRYTVDAKSLMGIFSLDLLKPLDFVIHAEEGNALDSILADVKDWIV
jgi:phosphotransferase system HPr-like phosphotransfer protein